MAQYGNAMDTQMPYPFTSNVRMIGSPTRGSPHSHGTAQRGSHHAPTRRRDRERSSERGASGPVTPGGPATAQEWTDQIGELKHALVQVQQTLSHHAYSIASIKTVTEQNTNNLAACVRGCEDLKTQTTLRFNTGQESVKARFTNVESSLGRCFDQLTQLLHQANLIPGNNTEHHRIGTPVNDGSGSPLTTMPHPSMIPTMPQEPTMPPTTGPPTSHAPTFMSGGANPMSPTMTSGNFCANPMAPGNMQEPRNDLQDRLEARHPLMGENTDTTNAKKDSPFVPEHVFPPNRANHEQHNEANYSHLHGGATSPGHGLQCSFGVNGPAHFHQSNNGIFH